MASIFWAWRRASSAFSRSAISCCSLRWASAIRAWDAPSTATSREAITTTRAMPR